MTPVNMTPTKISITHPPDKPPVHHRVYGLLLVLVNVISALALFLLSVWFICASAIAGNLALALSFNYVIPSTLIRLLAFSRILSGYGERLINHIALLDNLRMDRLKLFDWFIYQNQRHLQAPHQSIAVIDKLNRQTEAWASRFVTVWHPLLSHVGLWLIITAYSLATFPFTLTNWIVFWGVSLITLGLLLTIIRRHQLHINETSQQFKKDFQLFYRSANLWHSITPLKTTTRIESALKSHSASTYITHMIEAISNGVFTLLGVTLALSFIAYAISTNRTDKIPVLVSLTMLWLLAKDWWQIVVRSVIDMAKLEPPKTVERASKATQIGHNADPLKRLALQNFQWKRDHTLGDPITIESISKGVVFIEAGSGKGKSSLFLALGGNLDFHGQIIINEQIHKHNLAAKTRSNFHIELQNPAILAGSLKDNLLAAGAQATDEQLLGTLSWADLNELATPEKLTTWLGRGGQQLSGGEIKRLGLARAQLSQKKVWCLDEPFEGLDKQKQTHMAEKIAQQANEHIIFIASHIKPACLSCTQTIRF